MMQVANKLMKSTQRIQSSGEGTVTILWLIHTTSQDGREEKRPPAPRQCGCRTSRPHFRTPQSATGTGATTLENSLASSGDVAGKIYILRPRADAPRQEPNHPGLPGIRAFPGVRGFQCCN